jgi:hypothetical protein
MKIRSPDIPVRAIGQGCPIYEEDLLNLWQLRSQRSEVNNEFFWPFSFIRCLLKFVVVTLRNKAGIMMIERILA